MPCKNVTKSIFFLGDFNARCPQLGDPHGHTTVNGSALLDFINLYELNKNSLSIYSLSRGHIDYSINSEIIQQNVTVDTVDELSSYHYVLLTS